MLRRALLPLRLAITRQLGMGRNPTVSFFCSGKSPKGTVDDYEGFKGFGREKKQPQSKPSKESQKETNKDSKQKPKQDEPQKEPQKQSKKEQQKQQAQQDSSTAGSSTGSAGGPTGGDPDPNNNWKSWSEQLEKRYKEYSKRWGQWYSNYKFRYYHLLWLVLLAYLYPYRWKYNYSEFLKQLEEERVTSVTILAEQNTKIRLKTVHYTIDGFKAKMITESTSELLEKLKEHPKVTVKFSGSSWTQKLAGKQNQLFFIAVLGIFLLNIRLNKVMEHQMKKGGGGAMFDPSKKKFDMIKDVKTKFKDVAGLKESKFEVEQFVDFLRNPAKYKYVGARIPKGALLTGPPGTGKTMLAKACAGEAGVPFFFASGSDFVQMYVGVGAARIRELFKEAKAMSPSIIFIDEIDAVGRKRQDNLGSNDERDGTLNQLLVEMDGFGTDTKVIVMAATNRKELLDSALTRPGRFDRNIEINLPDLEGRWEIFMVHLSPLKLNPVKTKDEYARRLSTLTPGFSGAEIANICNEAAILAARNGKLSVDTIDFEMATERVLGGVERKSLVSEEERKVVAVHQSGHGVVSWFLEGAFPLLKLTIIPRSKGALGFAQYLPKESMLQSKEELIDRICFILGGRCAEEHFFKRITTGAYDDLQKAYQIAQTLITKHGMSPKLGYMSFQESDYLKNYSDETGDLIDKEIKAVIDRCKKITMDMVARHEAEIRSLSDALLKKESLDGKEILEILGNRPFEHHASYKAYLEMQKKDEEERKSASTIELPPPEPKPQ